MWHSFDSGRSVGTKGSEGRITQDEEHDLGARVTLERDGLTAPWTVTCGIYGYFVHTAFAATEDEGKRKFEDIKRELVEIMNEDSKDRCVEMIRHVADTY